MNSMKRRLLQYERLQVLVLVFLMMFPIFLLSCNSDKVPYDFVEHFEKAKVDGLMETPKDANPWGKTVAKIEIERENDKKKIAGIFSAPTSLVAYSVKIPSGKDIFFITSLGYHPATRTWNSDGVRMKVEVVKDNSAKVIVDKYVMPQDGFINVEVPLSEFAGESVKIKFSSTNDPGKNGDGDWPVWLEPKIISK